MQHAFVSNPASVAPFFGPTASVGQMTAAAPPEPIPVLPNAISFAGYCAGLAYLGGASPWWAVASIVADELDGRVARATGQTSEFGGNADWAIDLTLTGLYMERLKLLPALPLVTAGQVYLRARETRPPLLSARALLMMYALYKTGFGPLPPR